MPKTYAEGLTEIVEKYRAAGQEWPASVAAISSWAITRKLWDVTPEKKAKALARDLSSLFGHAKHRDPSGSESRTYASARRAVIDDEGEPTQQYLWCDVRDGNHEHVVLSFLARGNQISSDRESYNNDAESYNLYYKPKGRQPIPLFEFAEPLEV